MWAQNGISRRHVLGMAVTVGGLAIAGGIRGVGAQVTKRIEQFAPGLEKILSTSEAIQELADGFGGARGPPKGLSGGRKAVTCCSAIFITINV